MPTITIKALMGRRTNRWVQQEKPEQVSDLLLGFLNPVKKGNNDRPRQVAYHRFSPFQTSPLDLSRFPGRVGTCNHGGIRIFPCPLP
ncbi:MAG: hypothetical protein HXY45_16110 [Syntrophaceae bacterium]|nr:hypothetical protein [Syntrophaceae bacterium]